VAAPGEGARAGREEGARLPLLHLQGPHQHRSHHPPGPEPPLLSKGVDPWQVGVYSEMEFFENKKDSGLLLQAIHCPLFWRIFKKTNHTLLLFQIFVILKKILVFS
jgi:hypothetical protein